mmetsp:Transcript_28226/g.39015  ORF Transcript_28226/g.39015 Transcript_28226/m.39015 type:complete len:305 (-) Transcript_28226:160-1074(-)|eukprot:CAMPEP_0196575820 /NCGR_PEP_ID=MMETSP1081-20130531/5218_1 /TAXON_ID=36882 /ORGANISM="Pyramimonas amylifera, Strain CCMP720" /LENGTH=304 /DNA_ID=CAMNT_0041894233 /DNA_START=199 /DNA_END=1113 /DNA_ORIENTATION=-
MLKVTNKVEHDIPELIEEPCPEVLECIDTLVLDCDGVLWQGEELIPGSAEALAKFREDGKRLLFLTNNSSKSREMYMEKFKQLGIQADKSEIIGAAYSAAAWLKWDIGFTGKALVIGDVGITKELEEFGIESFTLDSNLEPKKCGVDWFKALKIDPDVGAVVVGCDHSFNYHKLAYASCCIQQGALFVATNTDAADSISGRLMPGAGAMVLAIQTASGQEPDVMAGKPSDWLLQLLKSEYGVDPSTTAFVGDRLDTDIQMGINARAALNVLTLSGVSTWEDAENLYEESKSGPDIVIPSLNFLI